MKELTIKSIPIEHVYKQSIRITLEFLFSKKGYNLYTGHSKSMYAQKL